MPGFLTGVFDGGDGGETTTSNSQSLALDEALAIEPSITVGTEYDVTFTDAEGTTHNYSGSNELTVTVGVEATLGLAADVTESVTTADF
jgi:hypothetical protein